MRWRKKRKFTFNLSLIVYLVIVHSTKWQGRFLKQNAFQDFSATCCLVVRFAPKSCVELNLFIQLKRQCLWRSQRQGLKRTFTENLTVSGARHCLLYRLMVLSTVLVLSFMVASCKAFFIN